MTQPASIQHSNNHSHSASNNSSTNNTSTNSSDTARRQQQQQSMKDDGELSFEDLTFGDDSHVDHHSNHDSESPNGAAPTSPVLASSAAPNGGVSNGASVVSPRSPRHKSKKQPVDPKKAPVSLQDVDRNSVFVSFADPAKVQVAALLRQMESFGTVEAYYFKDKQTHGFVHFADSEAADAAVAYFHNTLFEGCHIAVEHATRAPMQGSTPQSVGNNTQTGTSLPSNGPAVPEKPDTILVLKNLPFHLKQEQLSDILLHILSTQPQSINLHFDNLGVFRGMAFVKYHKLDDAITVYDALNGYDVSGRKVRVEYKRKPSSKVGEVPTEWLEDAELHDLWERVKTFRDAPDVQELPLPNLSSAQRKQIHAMADKLKLVHYSTGDGEARCLNLSKKSQPPTTNSTPSSSYNKNEDNKARAIEIKGRRRGDTDTKVTSPQGSVENQASSFGRSRYGSSGSSFGNKFSASAPDHDGGAGSWRNAFHHNTAAAMGTTPTTPSTTPSSSYSSSHPSSSLPSAFSAIQPCRQPRGPDGSSGFGEGYKSVRRQHSGSLSSPPPVLPAEPQATKA